MSLAQTWQNVARKAQKIRDDSVQRVPGGVAELSDTLLRNVTTIPHDLLDADALKITSQNCEEILSNLRGRKTTSIAVTRAFLRRAALAEKLVSTQSMTPLQIITYGAV